MSVLREKGCCPHGDTGTHRAMAGWCCRPGAACAAALHWGTATGATPALPLAPLPLAVLSYQVMLHRDWRAPSPPRGFNHLCPCRNRERLWSHKVWFCRIYCWGFALLGFGSRKAATPPPWQPWWWEGWLWARVPGEAGQRCQARDMSWHWTQLPIKPPSFPWGFFWGEAHCTARHWDSAGAAGALRHWALLQVRKQGRLVCYK